MEFELGEHVETFRAQVREFMATHVTPDLRARMLTTGTHHDDAFHRALGERGWIGADWPAEEGGQDRDAFEMMAFREEAERAGAPVDGLATTRMVADTVRHTGSAEQRDQILPGVLDGSVVICLGYTEPGSGSDVAAARTRAERDHEGAWRINGTKMFTTLAQVATHVFLLTRTSQDASKRAGLTMFLVPMESAGIEVRAIETLGGKRTNETEFRDVRVDDVWRVGDVGGGWRVLTMALNFERGGAGHAHSQDLLEEMVRWFEAAAGSKRQGLLDDDRVSAALGRIARQTEVARLLHYRTAWEFSIGDLDATHSSMAKLHWSESLVHLTEVLMDLAGPNAIRQENQARAPLGGELERSFRQAVASTIYAGTSEIQRSLIAEMELGLPRTRPGTRPS